MQYYMQAVARQDTKIELGLERAEDTIFCSRKCFENNLKNL